MPDLSPLTVPILAIPWTVSGQPIAIGPGQVTDPPAPNPVGLAESNVTITGGWRQDDGSGYEAMPVAFKQLAIPSLPCPHPIGTAPLISVTNTDDLTFSGASRDESIDEGTGSSVHAFGESARCTLLPNLARSIYRMNSDYRAQWVRGAFPSATARATHLCGEIVVPPNTVSVIDDEEFLPERAEFLAHVTNDPHVISEPMDDTIYAPYRVSSSGLVNGVPGDPAGFHSIDSEFPHSMSSPSGAFVPLTHIVVDNLPSVRAKYIGYWAHPHWSFLLAMKAWVGGSIDGYWLPLRQQQAEHSSLPPSENTKERSFVITEPGIEGALLAAIIKSDYLGYRTSWIGIKRFITGLCLDGTALRYVLDSASSSEWNLDIDGDSNPDDAVAVFGSKITLQPLGGSSPKRTIEYDLGNWNNPPYMTAHHAHEINIGWEMTNVESVKVELIGRDGASVVLSDSGATGDIPWPLGGKSTTFAGSWVQDYLQGPGSDEAGGSSAATMADPESNFAFQYLPSKTARWLRFTFTVVEPTDDVFLEYPEFVVAEPGSPDPVTVHETAQVADVVRPSGPGTRFGQLTHWNYRDDFYITTPQVRDPADQASILDVIGYRNTAWRAKAPDDGLDAELATLFDPREFDVRADFARNSDGLYRDTHGFIMESGDSSPLYVLVSSLREVPPLMMFPGRNRAAPLWEPTGALELATYSLCQGPRKYVSAHAPLDLRDPSDDTVWTNAASFVTGWKLRTHDRPTDGSEGLFGVVANGIKKGEGEPYHGFFGTFGARPAWNLCNHHGPFGGYSRAGITQDGLLFDWVKFPIPVDDDGVLAVFDHSVVVREADQIEYLAWPDITHDEKRSELLIAWAETSDGDNWDVLYANSFDYGRTWIQQGVIITGGTMARVVSNQYFRLFMAFVPDGDPSGPGTIQVRYQSAGSSAPDAAVTLKDENQADIKIEAGGFDPSIANDRAGRVLLTAVEEGDTEASDWQSWDDGRTFLKIQ